MCSSTSGVPKFLVGLVVQQMVRLVGFCAILQCDGVLLSWI